MICSRCHQDPVQDADPLLKTQYARAMERFDGICIPCWFEVEVQRRIDQLHAEDIAEWERTLLYGDGSVEPLGIFKH